ncbi:tubulointerstitial nephritis antigen-like [Latimeria chalumnae]|nr:PREDICTED: tubulointerstitial nephritis antigen-like [Latimeria chalumnae]|eukprot:XP_005997289.1 PREDICTED: tubulointerstitial nephritis antigen-like [Latimeria chalumnae]
MKTVVLVLVVFLVLLVEDGLTAGLVRTRRELSPGLHRQGIRDAGGSYCARRGPCCPGREDTCTMPYLDTICYCDLFCNRTASDCCPDFWDHCGVPRPPVYPRIGCLRNGHWYPAESTYRENCNLCTCGLDSHWICEQNVCLINEGIIDAINRGDYGWRAANYSQFWGMTLDEGIRYRLGTTKPSSTVMNMNELHMNMKSNEVLPAYFNAAEKWPGMVHEPLDQGNCAGSWAFSTAAVASDRISIQSMGHMTPALSPQNLISCDRKNQHGCNGGSIDRAWWYLRQRGVVTEECYPFTSLEKDTPHNNRQCMMRSRSTNRGKRQATMPCPNPYAHSNDIYQSTPPYKLSSDEKEVMKEIMENGPVQAIMDVHEDFFVYKSGIYQRTPVSRGKPEQYRRHGTHSVKIIGWGEERQHNGENAKYWIAANSWGRNWGEDGYFRISRGKNECNIETFIIGVWGRVTMEDMRKK